MKGENLLRNIFIVLMIFLFLLIISTPILVNKGISILDEEIKEVVEASILFFLVTIGFVIYFFYKKKLKQRERELNETLNYIGAVNLQVDQIRSLFDLLTKYPESKNDFKYLFESLASKALGGVNGEWVLFRIIDTASAKTLTEFTKSRGSSVLSKYEISNKDLLENKNPSGHWITSSMQENFNTKVFCVIPVESVNKNQEVLLQAIVNNLDMLYLIFKSAAVRS